jgi:hypothetical protein
MSLPWPALPSTVRKGLACLGLLLYSWVLRAPRTLGRSIGWVTPGGTQGRPARWVPGTLTIGP